VEVTAAATIDSKPAGQQASKHRHKDVLALSLSTRQHVLPAMFLHRL
jgi:hypothetical protein